MTLFLSLPAEAQAGLRARVNRRNPGDVRALTRAIYPWVQTLAEAQCVADYLIAETEAFVSPLVVERGRLRADSRMGSVPTVHAQ